MAMSSATSRISSSLQGHIVFFSKPFRAHHMKLYEKKGSIPPLRHSPFEILLRLQQPCLHKLVQQQGHAFSGLGTAFKR